MPHKYQNDMARNRGGPYKTDPATDLSRWRLVTCEGRERWKFVPQDQTPEREQTMFERRAVGLENVRLDIHHKNVRLDIHHKM